ncbi:hypothetical protein, partial [uncultured Chryseobacterium sp.]|uniref:hypothetical protein n=1 Tax=uncultured Chryseobacterium sp. TaxID=259322 RepID=UPI00258B6694
NSPSLILIYPLSKERNKRKEPSNKYKGTSKKRKVKKPEDIIIYHLSFITHYSLLITHYSSIINIVCHLLAPIETDTPQRDVGKKALAREAGREE